MAQHADGHLAAGNEGLDEGFASSAEFFAVDAHGFANRSRPLSVGLDEIDPDGGAVAWSLDDNRKGQR